MNNLSLIFLQLLIVIIKFTNILSHLILPFQEHYKSKLNLEDYFKLKFYNEVKTFLNVGTHRQLIPCYLSINTYTIYISGSNSTLKEGQIKYEEYKSKKYQNISNKLEYESTNIYGMPSIDEICLNNEIVFNLKFYLAKKKFSSNELYYSCVIGLGYEGIMYNYEDEDINLVKIESFITQMKNNEIINKKIFFINYNNNDGQIIFGLYPHEIKNNYCKSCIEEDYIEIENNFIIDTEIIWSIKGYVYVGENKIYDYLCCIDFELNQGFIIGSNDYKENVEKNFFNEKISKNECFKKERNKY